MSLIGLYKGDSQLIQHCKKIIRMDEIQILEQGIRRQSRDETFEQLQNEIKATQRRDGIKKQKHDDKEISNAQDTLLRKLQKENADDDTIKRLKNELDKSKQGPDKKEVLSENDTSIDKQIKREAVRETRIIQMTRELEARNKALTDAQTRIDALEQQLKLKPCVQEAANKNEENIELVHLLEEMRGCNAKKEDEIKVMKNSKGRKQKRRSLRSEKIENSKNGKDDGLKKAAVKYDDTKKVYRAVHGKDYGGRQRRDKSLDIPDLDAAIEKMKAIIQKKIERKSMQTDNFNIICKFCGK